MTCDNQYEHVDGEIRSFSPDATNVDDRKKIDTKQTCPIDLRREFFFYKGNGITSKARLRSENGAQYRLAADIHTSKTSTMTLYDGQNPVKSPCIGMLSFPPTHNDFQCHLHSSVSTSAELVQVRARVGHPDPGSYTLRVPATSNTSERMLTWERAGGTRSTTGYRLVETPWNTSIASWSLVSGEKHQAVFRWHSQPCSNLEALIVLLSFIGSMTRLRLKGKDELSDWPSSITRWNAMWFMAVLGTAAID